VRAADVVSHGENERMGHRHGEPPAAWTVGGG
jgi:hypothetical protein